MNLATALRQNQESTVAFVGAGGKTTAMFQLGRDLGRALVTTTTHLAVEQLALADQHFVGLRDPQAELPPGMDAVNVGITAVTGDFTPDGRLAALDSVSLENLHALAKSCQIPLLVEADGARRLPLKAPADHEPAIPPWVETVVVVAGLSGLGKLLSPEWVHRPERFAALSGLNPGDLITSEALIRVLLHASGGLKNIPPAARCICLLTQADSAELQSTACGMVEALLAGYAAIVVADHSGVMACFENVSGIVLAAGSATRFGGPKQLLLWDGEPLVRRAARTALEAGLRPVVVVTGAYAEQVEPVLAGLDVQIARCENWQDGQSASLRCGVRALSSRMLVEPVETELTAAGQPGFDGPVGFDGVQEHRSTSAGGAIFLLADQPNVPATLLRSLADLHAQTLTPIVAPLIDGQRGNPVLFDCATFPDMLTITGDTGGRALFSRYPITWLPWHDASVLLDIDHPSDQPVR